MIERMEARKKRLSLADVYQTRWRHEMASVDLCDRKPLVASGFLSQRDSNEEIRFCCCQPQQAFGPSKTNLTEIENWT